MTIGKVSRWRNSFGSPHIAWCSVLVLLFELFISCQGSADKRSDKTYSESDKANAEKPFIIEVIGASGKEFDADALIDVSKQNGLNDPETFQWKNHLVVYGKIKEAAILEKQAQAKFPEDTVKVYRDLFYEFNRQRCDSPKITAEWENIILTANLVKDASLQKEYLDYHATQFENWPEVAKGFCRAQFQQLLLFRNGRQLMLVISIPKSTSFDELNPKTRENNPKVDEWNALMKKYQEGIPGTTPGEVWVFLKPIKKE